MKVSREKGIRGTAFIFAGTVLSAAYFTAANLFFPLTPEGRWKEVMIPEGATYSRGIEILMNEGIIRNRFIFQVLGRITDVATNLKPGYYHMNTSMSPWSVFSRVKKGMIVQHSVTIPEGSDLESIRVKLVETGLLHEESWELVYDSQFLMSLGINAQSLEGYIYPDTYSFAKGMKPENIFRIMVQRLREVLDEDLLARAAELGMSEREVLTLASIIEKEALYDRERPIISAVYHNRLKKNMRLQADPTVNYGVQKSGAITRSDLKRATPYNTYVIYGLPPGPIASPGIRSIRAALFPSDVDYLYFVSKNNGTHHFSRTGKEHMKAVMTYQRGERK
jgi:UPF0755 protein